LDLVNFFYYFIPEARDDLEKGNEMVKAEMEITEELKCEKAKLQEGNL
jgi:hypothetical protein